MSNKRFDEFCEMYSSFKLPFYMNTRPETITEYRAKKLKEINCDRVNIGVEHGNEKFRSEVIKRNCSNDVIIRSFELMHDVGISCALNNIIGYPDETRELVFDTIELSRQIKSNGINAYIFSPYKGTQLRHVSEQRGYIDSKTLSEHGIKDSVLTMPNLAAEEIRGLVETFVLYATLPKTLWADIEIAEKNTEAGIAKRRELEMLYQSEYRN
jgi:anaerobic magnesium-protoporphyrin IX monomethyl ester cyclase